MKMKKFLEHKMVNSIFLFSFLLVFFGWAIAYFSLRKVYQPLVLHFSDAAGINQIGGLGDLSAVAVFAIVSLVFDLLLSIELDKRDPFLGKVTAAAGFFIAVLIFIGFSAIISVN